MVAPTREVLDMQNAGMNDADIIRRLREAGYTEKDINDAFNQAKVKTTVRAEPYATSAPAAATGELATPAPTQTAGYAEQEGGGWQETAAPASAYPEGYGEGYGYGTETEGTEGYGYPQQAQAAEAYTAETFEEIAESIIEEKWQEFTEKVGDLRIWKETIDRDIERIEKRIERIEDSINSIQAAIMEKVGEYGKGVKSLGTDVKAMEKALKDIIEPLMKNVKEVKGITERIKRKKG